MHKLVHILLLFATAFGSVTGVYSGRRVLCVGDGNHVAIEAMHGVCPSGSDDHGSHPEAADSEMPSQALTSSKACVDYELPVRAADRQPRVNPGVAPFALVPFLTTIPTALAGDGAWVEVASRALLDDLPACSLRCVRSVVLLI